MHRRWLAVLFVVTLGALLSGPARAGPLPALVQDRAPIAYLAAGIAQLRPHDTVRVFLVDASDQRFLYKSTDVGLALFDAKLVANGFGSGGSVDPQDNLAAAVWTARMDAANLSATQGVAFFTFPGAASLPNAATGGMFLWMWYNEHGNAAHVNEAFYSAVRTTQQFNGLPGAHLTDAVATPLVVS